MIKEINKMIKKLKKCKIESSTINHEQLDKYIIMLKTTKGLLKERTLKQKDREKIIVGLPGVLEAMDNAIDKIMV